MAVMPNARYQVEPDTLWQPFLYRHPNKTLPAMFVKNRCGNRLASVNVIKKNIQLPKSGSERLRANNDTVTMPTSGITALLAKASVCLFTIIFLMPALYSLPVTGFKIVFFYNPGRVPYCNRIGGDAFSYYATRANYGVFANGNPGGNNAVCAYPHVIFYSYRAGYYFLHAWRHR